MKSPSRGWGNPVLEDLFGQTPIPIPPQNSITPPPPPPPYLIIIGATLGGVLLLAAIIAFIYQWRKRNWGAPLHQWIRTFIYEWIRAFIYKWIRRNRDTPCNHETKAELHADDRQNAGIFQAPIPSQRPINSAPAGNQPGPSLSPSQPTDKRRADSV